MLRLSKLQLIFLIAFVLSACGNDSATVEANSSGSPALGSDTQSSVIGGVEPLADDPKLGMSAAIVEANGSGSPALGSDAQSSVVGGVEPLADDPKLGMSAAIVEANGSESPALGSDTQSSVIAGVEPLADQDSNGTIDNLGDCAEALNVDACTTDLDENVWPDRPTTLGTYDLNQEYYSYERILSVKAQGGLPGEGLLGLGNTLTAYGEYYYVLLMEYGTGRPKILKISQRDTSQIEYGYLEPEDYIPRADSHHNFTMEVDEEGYLHVIGDMHNYTNSAGSIERTQDHLPARLQGQHILYWRTTIPETVSSFQFFGQTDTFSPKGDGFTYVKLIKDKAGAVYFSARNNIGKVYDPSFKLNNRGAGLSRYDIESGTWEVYGDFPKVSENPVASAPVLAYETKPEADSHFYTKIISSVTFDNANRLHFATTLNNNQTDVFRDIAAANGLPGMYHWNTDLIYLRSDDRSGFVKADSSLVGLPAGIEEGGDQADIVYTRNDPQGDSILGIETDITTNRFGDPVIAFDKKALYPGAFSGDGATFAQWEDEQWKIYEALGDDESLDRSFEALMTDSYGVITFIPKGSSRFWRMWSLDGELHEVPAPEGMDHNIGKPSESFFSATGDILSRVYDDDTEMLTVFRLRIHRPGTATF